MTKARVNAIPFIKFAFNLSFRAPLSCPSFRYYARFIVVCLLLKKMKLCRDLIKDLQKHIEDYSSIYEPEDRLEWQLVVSEVKSFLEAEYIVRVVDVDSSSVVLSHRCEMAFWRMKWRIECGLEWRRRRADG